MVTADQLVLHAIGDYVLQSDWMATRKRDNLWACFFHALSYTLPFLFLSQRAGPLAFIFGTHFVIDRFQLARYLVWAKNFLAPKYIVDHVEVLPFNRGEHTIMRRNHPWSACSKNGYHSSSPPWLAGWLYIIADNVLHVLCNAFALAHL